MNLSIDAIDYQDNMYEIKSCQFYITDNYASHHRRHGRFVFKSSDFIINNLIFIFVVNYEKYCLICMMPSRTFTKNFKMPRELICTRILNFAPCTIKKLNFEDLEKSI